MQCPSPHFCVWRRVVFEVGALQIERRQPAQLDLLELWQHLFGEADHRLLIVRGRETGDQVAVADL